ncbi:DEAD/DEAH box helicase [Candidatus Dojkabacteria bacterium]|jgi:SWI/SNF-related matrix-associated actin-dependent regulator 1 of chromatin subfamily A|nr:DEAD/DEAH box helicase [Candidatus Dojkabacteria bacterium]
MANQNLEIIEEKSNYHCYAFTFPFSPYILEFCRDLKKKYGWEEFNFDEGKWRFSLPIIIREIKNYLPDVVISIKQDPNTVFSEQERGLLTPETVQKFDTAIEEAKTDLFNKAQQVKQQKNPTIDIKGLKLLLYDYQKLGVEFLTAAGGRAILADGMGSGKTAQSIAYLVHNKIPKTLVICPASVKFAWESEINKWSKLKPLVIDGKFWNIKSISSGIELLSEHDVIIINYDLLNKFKKLLLVARFDCLVVDEYHMIKNSRSIRAKLTKLISLSIPKIILLSGTPMLNRPIELFNGLNILDSKTWNSWWKFSIRYCNGHRDRFGWNTSGASNLDELKERISPYFLRRTKQEILTELPPKNFIDIPILLSPEIQKTYNTAENNLAKFLKDIKNKSDDEVKRSLSAEKLVKLNELRQITTSGKLETAKELIDQIIDNGEKVVVFSVYNSPLEQLNAHYGSKSVLVTGKTASELRGSMVQEFQTNPNIQIFLGGTRAAGIGITLTAASNVIFLDFDWVPAMMEQAMDRIHRIGQEAESINIYQIYAKDTIDDYMRNLLSEKQTIVDKLISGNSDSEESYVKSLFKNLELKYKQT